MFIRQMDLDLVCKLWKFCSEDLVGSIYNQLSSTTGSAASEDENVFQFVKKSIMGDCIAQIDADALPDLRCSLIPCLQLLLEKVELICVCDTNRQLYPCLRRKAEDCLLGEILPAAPMIT
jgi:hypothetical protein